MSVKPHVNDDEKEIHELPEIATLPEGMMVAVDSERTGTKSFNLTDALEEKIDSPATPPTTGQVLTFDGNDKVWSDPPEGVYILNYSEVTDISDLDLEKLKSIPTFLVVDESGYYVNLPHTAQGGSTSNRIDIKEGMIFRLTEYSESTPPLYTFTSPYTGSFYGGSAGIGDYYNGLLKITLFTEPGNTQLYKSIQYKGEINNGSLNRGMSVPHTTYYSGDEDYGPWDSNATVNSSASLTKMYEFGNKARKQIELPPEVLTRQLGSSSNAPTLKTMLGFDVDNNANSCRFGQMVLFRAASQMSNQAYPEQTPQDLKFMEFVMGNPAGNLDDDQRCMSISMTLKDSTGTVSSNRSLNYLVVPDTSNAIDANIVPNVLKYWTDSKGGHMDWQPVNEVPASISSDSGRVLTVDSNGTPIWSYGTPPVTLYHHWEKANGDYDDNTEYLDLDVSSSGIKSAIVVIQMTMNAGKYVFFNVEGINMSNSTFGGTENYAHNNSEFNGIKPSVTNIMDYQYIGIKAIRIKHHGSQQHKFSTETSGIDIKVIGFK